MDQTSTQTVALVQQLEPPPAAAVLTTTQATLVLHRTTPILIATPKPEPQTDHTQKTQESTRNKKDHLLL